MIQEQVCVTLWGHGCGGVVMGKGHSCAASDVAGLGCWCPVHLGPGASALYLRRFWDRSGQLLFFRLTDPCHKCGSEWNKARGLHSRRGQASGGASNGGGQAGRPGG